MKIKYIKKIKINSFENEKLTYNKEYEVLADYRKRNSHQNVKDNGLVIKNDKSEIDMVFLNDGFIIIENIIENTFIFNYKSEVL